MSTLQENVSFKYENNEIVIEGDSFIMSVPMSTIELYKVYSTGKGTGVATLKIREQDSENSQEEEVMEDLPAQDEEEVTEGRAILDIFAPNRIESEPTTHNKDEEVNMEFRWKPYNYFNKKPYSDNG